MIIRLMETSEEEETTTADVAGQKRGKGRRRWEGHGFDILENTTCSCNHSGKCNGQHISCLCVYLLLWADKVNVGPNAASIQLLRRSKVVSTV